MSTFVPPGPAEILSLVNKDESYLNSLKQTVTDLFQKVAGIRTWIQWRNEIDALCDATYFSLTTLSGLQTLGEEYSHVVQTDGSLRQLPSFMRRSLSVFAYCFGPLLYKYSLKLLKQKLSQFQSTSDEHILSKKNQKILSWLLDHNLEAATLLQRLHLVIFYFSSAYYFWSRRFTGIRYVLLRSWLHDSSITKTYRIIAWLSLINYLIYFYVEYIKLCPTADSQQDSNIMTRNDAEINSEEKCVLCLGQRKYTSATPCGHLFCWSCIMSWLRTKEACPVCRQEFTASRVILLQNYDETQNQGGGGNN